MTDPKLEARDPNCSPKRLAELLYGFTDDVLENPALPLVLLENPHWVNELQAGVASKLLRRPELPEYLANALTQHSNLDTAADARMHVALGEDITDWEFGLKNLGALYCPYDSLQILKRHQLIPLWLQPYMKPELVVIPARSRAKKPKPPLLFTEERKQELLAASEPQLLKVARDSKSVEELEFLLEYRYEVICTQAAQNSLTPLPWIQKLMQDPDCWSSLIQNRALTAEQLSTILDKAEATGQINVVNNIGGSPACTLTIAKRLERMLGTRGIFLARFYSGAELTELYLEGERWAAGEACMRDDAPRWLIAENLLEYQNSRPELTWFCGQLAVNNQKRLSRSVGTVYWSSRFAIALNPITKPATLEKLTNDVNRYVRFAARNRLKDKDWTLNRELGYE